MKKISQSTPSIQSLDRGLVILEAVAKAGGPVPLGELTDILGIDRSSVFRLANTLKRRGFLANPSGRKDYILGPSIWRLSHQYDWGNMLITLCHDHVKHLAMAVNETAHFAVREGQQALFIDHASVNHMIAVTGQTGELVPLYCTAHGKALLADHGVDSLRSLLGTAPLHPHTAHTVVSIDQLAEECSEIRARGYATDDAEFQEGIRCVAAPIRDRDGVIVASIGISAPATRFPEERYNASARQVCDVAGQITALLTAQGE